MAHPSDFEAYKGQNRRVQERFSERKYKTFMEHACTSRGASIGHKLVKTMVKDKTVMYQQVDNREAMLSGVTIEEMHAARISKWCYGKWATHSCAEHEGLQEALYNPNLSLNSTPQLPKHKLATIRQALLDSSIYAGQGPDHWVLKHWAFYQMKLCGNLLLSFS